MDKRYQFQKWYVKLWRSRYYIPLLWKVPTLWFRPFFWNMIFKEIQEEQMSFLYSYVRTYELMLSIYVGEAQYKMEYYYTWDEVKERFFKKTDINLDKLEGSNEENTD